LSAKSWGGHPARQPCHTLGRASFQLALRARRREACRTRPLDATGPLHLIQLVHIVRGGHPTPTLSIIGRKWSSIMRCPHCKQNIRVQGRFCPKCGEQIFGAPVRRQEPPPSAPSEPAPPAWSVPPPPSQPPQPAPPDLSDWSAAASQQPEFFDEDIIERTKRRWGRPAPTAGSPSRAPRMS